MPLRLGMNAKFYLKPGGLSGNVAWIEMGNVKDVTVDVQTGEADVTTRANAGWKASVSAFDGNGAEFARYVVSENKIFSENLTDHANATG